MASMPSVPTRFMISALLIPTNHAGLIRNQSVEISIIGGGIGGLTTALALHRAGIPCTIYESVGELRELGVGINLLPHAVR